MIYTPLTKKAIKLAYFAHHGQVDKAGLPYISHPLHLAEQMPDEMTTVVALLHDVVEDTTLTLEDLERGGFPPQAIHAIRLLTHERGVAYEEYIEKIAEDPIARTVKLADLKHNSDLSRLDVVSEKDRARVEKYARAIKFISEKIDCEMAHMESNHVFKIPDGLSRVEIYRYVMDQYRSGSFGEEHLSLGQILNRAGVPNLLNEMTGEELDTLIALTHSGMLKEILIAKKIVREARDCQHT